jgi:hypothetical protein
MLALLALWTALPLQDSASIPAHDAERRWVLASAPATSDAPRVVRDAEGKALPAQVERGRVWWIVPHVPAKASPTFSIQAGAGDAAPLVLADDPGGWISVRDAAGELTRYHHGARAETHKKPFWWPLRVDGVNLLRGYPVEERPGEAADHPHHSGIYHAFGEVNGKEYWSKLPITPKRVVERSAGAAFARLVVEHAWGEDLLELQEIVVLNAGAERVMDFRITLTAAGGPVVLGENVKMAKEGSFAVRVAAGLSLKKGDGPEIIRDAKGNQGEKAVRADTAPWVHYGGDVDGKRVGVAVMNHPSSFRYPTTWHVRAYGLFAANPWLVKGRSELAKGESLPLGYRIYAHPGGFDAGKVAAVHEGFAASR